LCCTRKASWGLLILVRPVRYISTLRYAAKRVA